ncbi:hypothetical protein [Mycoplasmopsis pullorum]|uniref:Uncharacterized protein n=1 Tax=Mycoplasmopsis pullorum TaxID=48003 RepID=A0A1L4FSS9_9BACT|nr:hypothetical protein [Mycoplasmopsis pullorum]APJ38681.1 hypothetical protein BLA55_03405 [Mycoplasmopsis pullorum]
MLQPRKLSSKNISLLKGINLRDTIFIGLFALLSLLIWVATYFSTTVFFDWIIGALKWQVLIGIIFVVLFFFKKESKRLYVYLYQMLIFKIKKRKWSYENK